MPQGGQGRAGPIVVQAGRLRQDDRDGNSAHGLDEGVDGVADARRWRNDATRFLPPECRRAEMVPIAMFRERRWRRSNRRPRGPRHSSLFIDDFEVIQESAVLALSGDIIDASPGYRIVIGSRRALELPCPFACAWATARSGSRCPALHPGRDNGARACAASATWLCLLARLHEKTEGWITALWLASTSLEREKRDSDFIERFSGSNRAIADYLAEDVLASQSPEVREFLLRTSVLRQLDASLCRALLPGTDTERILEKLAEQNLFLVALSDSPRTYRYHALFADFLRTRLAREHPDEIPRLHLAASNWYEAQNRRAPAIDHAIESGDYHRSSLLEQHAQHLLDRTYALGTMVRPYAARSAGATAASRAMVQASLFTYGPWQAQELERSDAGRAGSEVAAHVNAQWPLFAMGSPLRLHEAGRPARKRPPTSRQRRVLCNAMRTPR